MKLLILILVAVVAMAQPTPPPSITTGVNAPNPNLCDAQRIGNVYVRAENPSNGPINVSVCTQTGSLAYAWIPVGHFAGTTLPPKCSLGDIAVDTDAPAGANTYVCTAEPGTWTVQSGSASPGTVTSVSFTGGVVSVGTPTTTPAFTVAGTSGGILYFPTSTSWASSGALTANLPIIGGGVGASPSVGTVSGNTTAFVTTDGTQTSGDCVVIDASGNHVASGASCGLGASGSFSVVRSNATTLSIGPACSTAAPCTFAFGTTLYSLTTDTRTAVIASGTDTAYIYLTAAGTLTVGTDTQTVTCTGCTSVTGITAFPATSLPLWTWSSTGGVWATGVGTDSRVIVQKGADPLAAYWIDSADTQLANAVVVVASSIVGKFGGCSGTMYLAADGNCKSSMRGLSFSFDGGGAALSTGKTVYLRVPFACTITNWSIGSTTAETVTVKLWRVATGGTALPAVGNSISTSGVSLSTGTAVQSSTVSDFTSTAIAADDWLAANLTAVTASQFVNYTLGCAQ